MLWLAAATAMLGGGLCGILGYYVHRLGLVTLSFGIAHAALAGAAVGMVLGVDMTLTAMLFALGFALAIGALASRAPHQLELACMAFFAFFNAVALFMVYIANARVLATASVAAVLWGSVLAATAEKVMMLGALLALLGLYLAAFGHQVDAILFDVKLAEAEGIDVNLHTMILLLFVGSAIALTLKLTGGFLVFSLLYNPTAAALRISRRAWVQRALSPCLGAGCALAGLAASYALDWPVGAAIALLSTFALMAAAIARAAYDARLARRIGGRSEK